MAKFSSKQDIVNATLKGLVKAKDNFLKWTNNRLSLSYAPSKMLSIHIAQEIAKIKNPPEIFIDASVSDILRCSLKDRNSFLQYMQKYQISEGVFSITLDERFKHKNDNDSISRVIITVKNGVRNPKIEYLNEIERICKMLNGNEDEYSSLGMGVFAFYSDLPKKARKKLSSRIPAILEKFNEVVQKYPRLANRFESTQIMQIKDIGECIAGAYIIERINTPKDEHVK